MIQPLHKAWIPAQYKDKSETRVRTYINSISAKSKTWDASETLRFAQDKNEVYELLIPNALLPKKGTGVNPWGFFAQCFDTLDEMKKGMESMKIKYEKIDYTTAAWAKSDA